MPADGTDEDRELKARLDRLSSALNERRGQDSGPADEAKHVTSTGQAMSLGFRVLSEFVAGVVVGGVIGWQGDRWFGTSPFLLIVFLMAGTAAGFWNVYRIAARTGAR